MFENYLHCCNIILNNISEDEYEKNIPSNLKDDLEII